MNKYNFFNRFGDRPRSAADLSKAFGISKDKVYNLITLYLNDGLLVRVGKYQCPKANRRVTYYKKREG